MSIKHSKKLSREKDKERKVKLFKYTLYSVIIIIGIMLDFFVFIGWQRGMANGRESKEKRSKWQKDFWVDDTTQQMDRPYVELLKKQTYQLLPNHSKPPSGPTPPTE